MVDIVDAYESGDKDALRDAVDSFDDYREQFSHVIIDDDGSVSYDNYATQDDIVDTTLGIFDTSNNFKRDVYGIDPSEYGIHSKSTPYSPYDESLEESLTEIDEITSYKYLLRESYLDSNLSKTSKAKLQFMVNEGLHPAVISRFIERHSNEVQN